MRLSSEDYRKPFRRWVSPVLIFALVLLLLFSVVRFMLVLQANIHGSYQYISYIFMAMIILPFLIFYTKGRSNAVGFLSHAPCPGKSTWPGCCLRLQIHTFCKNQQPCHQQ